jgi:hypothetical protein
MTTQWANRIVGYADVEPSQLVPSDFNFRRHPKPQQDALTGLIGQIGYIDPVLVQAGTDRVIDGHLRVELALRTNQPTVPVQYVDLTDEEADLALASFDPVSAMAYHDAAQLDALLREVSTDDAAVMAMLSELAESAGIIPADVFDPNEHWKGMPEFHQEDREAIKQITVNFSSESDLEAFARLIEQNVRMTTNSIWYPAHARADRMGVAYVVDDADAA